jgi:hypothetical protein
MATSWSAPSEKNVRLADPLHVVADFHQVQDFFFLDHSAAVTRRQDQTNR